MSNSDLDLSDPSLSVGDFDDEDDEAKTGAAIAVRETKAVSYLRVVVIIVLFLTAAAVSVFIYLYTHQDQVDDFEQAAVAHSLKIIEAFHAAVDVKLGATNALGVAITAFARSQEQGLPFMTVPDFEVHGADSRILADAVLIWYAPLVRHDQRGDWEDFGRQNRQHLMQAYAAESAQTSWEDARYNYTQPQERRNLQGAWNSVVLEDGYAPVLHDLAGDIPYKQSFSRKYMPLWQMTPAVPLTPLLNFDLLTHPALSGSANAMLESGEAVMEFVTDLRDDYDELRKGEEAFELNLAMGQYRHDREEFGGDPVSAMAYPVFDTFGPERHVAGMLTTNIYWRLYFINVLPEDATGVVVVMENTFGQVFSYRIDGPVATYIGTGDRHDEKYDHLGKLANTAVYNRDRTSPTTRSYTTVPLNGDYCDYTVRVYPSQDMESQYVNNTPYFYALVVFSVFIFTSAVFLLYDLLVEHRQSIIMDIAAKSGAIVSSLFPSTVRDRLLEEEEVRQSKKMMPSDNGSSCEVDLSSRRICLPIADKFQDCSVLFADIAGFTKWSSDREPEAVFVLLEAFYEAFDKIATKRKVYKIETIGDCYLAVTGCPDRKYRLMTGGSRSCLSIPPKCHLNFTWFFSVIVIVAQPDHAARMIKFARQIMLKMGLLKFHLAETLGDDTRDLELRIGIHSGPVTAGVLRGQKSRFQLFGDTVNTASRMESNGSPGRIHVSEAVAKELERQQHRGWLTAREDKVVAKGKGEMQTYWVVTDGAKSAQGFTNHDTTTNMDESSKPVEEVDYDKALLAIQEKLQRRVSTR